MEHSPLPAGRSKQLPHEPLLHKRLPHQAPDELFAVWWRTKAIELRHHRRHLTIAALKRSYQESMSVTNKTNLIEKLDLTKSASGVLSRPLQQMPALLSELAIADDLKTVARAAQAQALVAGPALAEIIG